MNDGAAKFKLSVLVVIALIEKMNCPGLQVNVIGAGRICSLLIHSGRSG